jgi:hypothetical protein
MGWTIFNDKQGSGYIFTSKAAMEHHLGAADVTICGKIIAPGDKTDLSGFLGRELIYLGIKPGRDMNEMIFYIGEEKTLFDAQYYYQSIFRISDKRLFEMFSDQAGRDFNYIKGRWK